MLSTKTARQLSVLLLLAIAACASAGPASPAAHTTIDDFAAPKKCVIVACLVNPCSTTTCKPPPQWECVPNYCGGCKTTWKHSSTGLVLSTCPPSESSAACTFIYKPVCGVNGVSYANKCLATSKGIKVAYEGQCKCPTIHKPVCGANWVTYSNACYAYNHNTTVKYYGTCPFPTACGKYNSKYTPVCDSTGRTWPNACVAKLNGATDYKKGPCPGGICAKCLATAGCNAPHKCKGNPKYKCATAYCTVKHVLDTGKWVTYGACRPVYTSKATGFPVAACYP